MSAPRDDSKEIIEFGAPSPRTIRSVTIFGDRGIDASGFGGGVTVPVRFEYDDGWWHEDWMSWERAREMVEAFRASLEESAQQGSGSR